MADIIHRIGIKAPAAKVYEAVATTKGVAGWWTRDTSGAAAPGEKVDVRFRGADGKEIGQMEFAMTKLEADREVHWRFVAESETLRVFGNGLRGLVPPAQPIDCGNAGTLMRLLPGLRAAQHVQELDRRSRERHEAVQLPAQ